MSDCCIQNEMDEYIHGLAQDCSNCIATAPELLQFCAKLWWYGYDEIVVCKVAIIQYQWPDSTEA